MILNIIKPALFACYSLFLLMSFSAFGYSSVDEHYVFYLTKKDGGHTGHTVWYGTIGERKSSKNELVVFLKDKHQADSVTIAPVYPGYCGVLYSRQKKNGRTQYSLSTNRTMADAQKEAKEKRQNTYTDYDVHEVICSPKSCIQLNESPESCLAINTGTDTIEASLFCASGETKKYTIRKLNTKRKIFLVKSGYSQGVIKAKGKQPIDVDALSNIVCSEPKASETTALDIARSLLEFLGVTKKGWIDECIKNKSDKYCHSEWARRNPQPKASHGGGGRS